MPGICISGLSSIPGSEIRTPTSGGPSEPWYCCCIAERCSLGLNLWEHCEQPQRVPGAWLPILRREGLLVECPLDQLTTPADWVPLYTYEGLQKYLPAVLSSFTSQGAPSLTAIVPPPSSIWVQTRSSFCQTSTNTSAS